MKTQTTPTPIQAAQAVLDAEAKARGEDEAPAPAAPKAPKSASIRLVAPGAPDGVHPVEALILAYKNSSGWVCSATTFLAFAQKGVKRAGERGATFTEPTIAKARERLEKIAEGMVARGWVRPEKKEFGIRRLDDSFTMDSLPAPAGAAPKAQGKAKK